MKTLPEVQDNRLLGGKRVFQHFFFETDYVIDIEGLFPSNYVLILVKKEYSSATSFFYCDDDGRSTQVNVAILNRNTLEVVKWLQPTDLIHVDFVCKAAKKVGVENMTQASMFG